MGSGVGSVGRAIIPFELVLFRRRWGKARHGYRRE
jgi:hypothetical protein